MYGAGFGDLGHENDRWKCGLKTEVLKTLVGAGVWRLKSGN